MQEQTLSAKISDAFAKLSPSQIQHISRDDILDGPRIQAARRIDIEAYTGSSPRDIATRADDDLALSKLPGVPLDVRRWKNVISESRGFGVSLGDLFLHALSDRQRFPETFKQIERYQFSPPGMWGSLVAQEVFSIPDAEIRQLLLEREARQGVNRKEIKELFGELKEEIRAGLRGLGSHMKVPNVELPLSAIDKRLEKLHIEVFDPLLSNSFTDIAFYSILSHAVFISADLQKSDSRPIIRHEMLHAVSGVAPVIAGMIPPGAERNEVVDAMKQGFFHDRHALLALNGKDTSFVWLNEGVTEFLNQTIGGSAKTADCSVLGWGMMADVIRRISERVDISPLLNIYFSDAPAQDAGLEAQKAKLGANLKSIYGSQFLTKMEEVWKAEVSQVALCKFYDERYNAPRFRERVSSLYTGIIDSLFRRTTAS